MNLLIIGATGGTGRALVDQALEQGHNVTAFVRNPEKLRIRHERLSIAKGNVLDFDSLMKATEGKEAVLSALGHKKWFIPTSILSEGTRNILGAMERCGVRRLICETSLGVGDSRGTMGLYYTLFVIPFILFFYFRDKGRQEAYIRRSSLEWVIVRPGRLTNGRKRGTYRAGVTIGSYLFTVRISRRDVAHFMLKQLREDTWLRKDVAIAY